MTPHASLPPAFPVVELNSCPPLPLGSPTPPQPRHPKFPSLWQRPLPQKPALPGMKEVQIPFTEVEVPLPAPDVLITAGTTATVSVVAILLSSIIIIIII